MLIRSWTFRSEIHLWLYDRLCSESEWADLQKNLSPEEKLRAAKMNSSERASTFSLGRALLRKHLAEAIHCAPQEIEILLTPKGKPFLAKPSSPLTFSLSHSKDRILLALSPSGWSFGVDIEFKPDDSRASSSDNSLSTDSFTPTSSTDNFLSSDSLTPTSVTNNSLSPDSFNPTSSTNNSLSPDSFTPTSSTDNSLSTDSITPTSLTNNPTSFDLIAKKLFSEEDQKNLRLLSGEKKKEKFYELWCLAEARFKMQGSSEKSDSHEENFTESLNGNYHFAICYIDPSR